MPVCEPENRNDPLNVGFGLTFTCSKLNSKPALNVCAPQTLDTLSFRAYVLFACFKFVIGVPMTKELKMMFSTPSIDGARGTMPGVPTPVTKPCDARLGPTPPAGWPTVFVLRMKLSRSSFTVDGENDFVSASVIS